MHTLTIFPLHKIFNSKSLKKFFYGVGGRFDFSLIFDLPFILFILKCSMKPLVLHQNATLSPYGKTLIDRSQEEHLYICHRQKLLR